jgi:hypothetical protein
MKWNDITRDPMHISTLGAQIMLTYCWHLLFILKCKYKSGSADGVSVFNPSYDGTVKHMQFTNNERHM